MVDRYADLFAQLKIIEYQLKQEVKKHGQSAAMKLYSGRKGFVKPKVFKEILGK